MAALAGAAIDPITTRTIRIRCSSSHGLTHRTRMGLTVDVCAGIVSAFTMPSTLQNHMSLAVLGVKLGQDSEFNKEFHFFRDAVVKFVADRGANIRSSRARWTDLRTSILTYKKEEVEELQAPDTIKLLKNYVQEYGQPEHNGLGHQRIIYRGHDCVITGDRWWRSCSHI